MLDLYKRRRGDAVPRLPPQPALAAGGNEATLLRGRSGAGWGARPRPEAASGVRWGCGSVPA